MCNSHLHSLIAFTHCVKLKLTFMTFSLNNMEVDRFYCWNCGTTYVHVLKIYSANEHELHHS